MNYSILLLYLLFTAAASAKTPSDLKGIWQLTGVTCSKGALSEVGNKYARRLKSKELIVFYTFGENSGKMSSRAYSNPGEYCQGTSEEKLIFGKKKFEYDIANTSLKYRQNEQETDTCKGDYKNPDKRHQHYALEGDSLKVRSEYEWRPGKSKDAPKSGQACPDGEYVRIYKKVAKENFPD